MVPILRTTNYNGTSGQMVIQDFHQLHYISVNNSTINSVHVYFRSESGDVLPLKFGPVSITLHFRQKKI